MASWGAGAGRERREGRADRNMYLAVKNLSQLGLGDVAEHEAQQLWDSPGLREDSPHLLPCFQAFTQPVVPAAGACAEQRVSAAGLILVGSRPNKAHI